jgi:hypothetical protein
VELVSDEDPLSAPARGDPWAVPESDEPELKTDEGWRVELSLCARFELELDEVGDSESVGIPSNAPSITKVNRL